MGGLCRLQWLCYLSSSWNKAELTEATSGDGSLSITALRGRGRVCQGSLTTTESYGPPSCCCLHCKHVPSIHWGRIQVYSTGGNSRCKGYRGKWSQDHRDYKLCATLKCQRLYINYLSEDMELIWFFSLLPKRSLLCSIFIKNTVKTGILWNIIII